MVAILLQTMEPPTWGALGAGGVLAGLMFYFYRQDRKASEERLHGIIADFRAIIEANTKAMTALEHAIEWQQEHHPKAAGAR